MKMFRFMTRLWKDEEGATAIEYGLLAALIAVAIIAAATTVGGKLDDVFVKVADDLEEVVPTP